MDKTNILIVGAGRMGEAIIAGLMKNDSGSLGRITVANLSDRERLTFLENTYGIHTTQDWLKEVANHEVILLASPPNVQGEQLIQLGNKINGQLVITVAAGIDPTYMEKRLTKDTPVCWIMPNTAAQIGKSMSTYVYGQAVLDEHKKQCQLILNAIGYSEELTENQVHDLTAITGSAPAFVYMFVQGLEKAAVENGVNKEQARKLVTKMLVGSAAMLDAGYEPDQLINQVASPGGSTAEGLKVLKKERLEQIIQSAVKATNAHARGQGEGE